MLVLEPFNAFRVYPFYKIIDALPGHLAPPAQVIYRYLVNDTLQDSYPQFHATRALSR
jgi:hypothetical protein